MKTLYISDLDGTLLDSNASITQKTSEILNRLTELGLNFSFATARTAASAVRITAALKIKIPCILMNGVSVYDISEQRYIKNEYINHSDADFVSDVFKRHNLYPFMYKIEKGILYAMYKEFPNDTMKGFYELRKHSYGKPFLKCDDFTEYTHSDVVYFTICDTFERLSPIKCEIEKNNALKFTFYKDVYHPEYWFLEIFSHNASKYNAVNFLKEYCSFDKVTGFGDNLNDIPLFEACDMKVAVENAKSELKNIADTIIGDNNSDSVALWIEKNFLNERI